MAAYRAIPGCVVSAPRNETELKSLMFTALKYDGGPFIIRYPRGCGEGTDWRNAEFSELAPGKGECLLEGDRLAIIAAGPEACRAVEAAAIVNERTGVNVAIYDIRYIKPIDEDILERAAKCGKVLTVEEGCIKGGLFGAVTEYMAEKGHLIRIEGLGIPDEFIGQDKQASQRAECGLDAEGIAAKCMEMLEKM